MPAPVDTNAPTGKQRLSSEVGLSLAVALLALVFWGAYMLMVLAGELPEMMKHPPL